MSQHDDSTNKMLWHVLEWSCAILSGVNLVWAAGMLIVIAIRRLNINMVIILCLLQIGASLTWVISVFLLHSKHADYKHPIRNDSHHLDGVFIAFALWMIFTGLRNWLFDMKIWKLSLAVAEQLRMNRTHSRCLPLEQPIYYSAIILNVLVPMAMFIGYEVKETDVWKGFYIFWVVGLTASLYFLGDAYRRINSQIIKMANGQLR